MATALDSGIGTLNYGKQSAKGTIATAATTTIGYDQPKFVDGGLKINKKLTTEEYIDGQRFGSPTTIIDEVSGDAGSVTIQSQAENAGLYFAQILGSDTVTGASDPYTHTITSAGTAGAWGTWWQKTGSVVGPLRETTFDAKIAKLTAQCGADQNFFHQQMDVMALQQQVHTVDPAKAQATTDSFFWTEAATSWSINSITVAEVEEDVVTVDTGMEAFYGDNYKPAQLIEKKGTITRTVKTIVTDATLQQYLNTIYGSTAPTAATQPTGTVLYVPITCTYTKSANRTLTITTPNVAVDPADMQIAPQAQGGKVEITFGGNCLKSGATPALSVIAKTADATGY